MRWEGDLAVSAGDHNPRPQRSATLYVVLIVAGAGLLTVGVAWGWQAWSQRSAEPIDNLLPVLAADGQAGTAETAGAVGPAEAVVAEEPQSALPAGATTVPAVDDGPIAESLIIVHVSGAVERAGVVELVAGSRVFHAVAQAGGASQDADLERVNLAAPLVDGERIHVPRRGEDQPPALVPTQRPVARPAEPDEQPTAEVVDINAAGETELQQLPGVGPSLAQAIVRLRTERGPFFTVDELLDVPGIGAAKLAAIAPQAIVTAPVLIGE